MKTENTATFVGTCGDRAGGSRLVVCIVGRPGPGRTLKLCPRLSSPADCYTSESALWDPMHDACAMRMISGIIERPMPSHACQPAKQRSKYKQMTKQTSRNQPMRTSEASSFDTTSKEHIACSASCWASVLPVKGVLLHPGLAMPCCSNCWMIKPPHVPCVALCLRVSAQAFDMRNKAQQKGS